MIATEATLKPISSYSTQALPPRARLSRALVISILPPKIKKATWQRAYRPTIAFMAWVYLVRFFEAILGKFSLPSWRIL